MSFIKQLLSDCYLFKGEKETALNMNLAQELLEEAEKNIKEFERITMNGEDKWLLEIRKETGPTCACAEAEKEIDSEVF